ncbi:MAG: PQQ-dependent sugar dehydrogenase [Planctomycetota bacterium]
MRTAFRTICCLAFTGGASAQLDVLPSPPPGSIEVRLTTLTDQLTAFIDGRQQFTPVDMSPFPDGSERLAVLTLGGFVHIIDDDGTQLPEPYLDVVTPATDLTAPGSYGIISIAFHPDFADDTAPGHRKFYIIETEFVTAGVPDFDDSLLPIGIGGQHHDVIYEYTVDDTAANVFTGTRREVLRIEQPGADHNTFDLAFGVTPADEGLLYIPIGDGAVAGQAFSTMRENARTPNNVFGTIIRIDPLGTNGINGQYGVPASNPFVGTPGARPEVYSIGHRSPYRLTADRLTGELWLGEVGQDQIEEVNRIIPGANYGWPDKEGSFLFDQTDHSANAIDADLDGNGTGDFADANGYTDPVFEVDHQTAQSITGGFVYRGSAIPELQGRYTFGNASPGFPTGIGLYHGDPANGPVSGDTGGVEEFVISPEGDPLPSRVISIGEDLNGELYILGLRNGFQGVLLRADPVPGDGCLADTNGDGVVNPADFSAWVIAFNNQCPACDQNGDGLCNPADFNAWAANFNAGC